MKCELSNLRGKGLDTVLMTSLAFATVCSDCAILCMCTLDVHYLVINELNKSRFLSGYLYLILQYEKYLMYQYDMIRISRYCT